jgi:hypothetical protein
LGDAIVEQDFSKYLFEYYHEGSWWNLEVPARSEEDAKERIKLMHRARLLGTVETEFAALSGARYFARFLCWCRNTWAAKMRLR